MACLTTFFVEYFRQIHFSCLTVTVWVPNLWGGFKGLGLCTKLKRFLGPPLTCCLYVTLKMFSLSVWSTAFFVFVSLCKTLCLYEHQMNGFCHLVPNSDNKRVVTYHLWAKQACLVESCLRPPLRSKFVSDFPTRVVGSQGHCCSIPAGDRGGCSR